MQGPFEAMQRASHRGTDGDRHRRQHPGDGCMHARKQHRIPERDEQQQIDGKEPHPQAPQHQHRQPDKKRRAQRQQIEAGGIEKGDDRHRAQIIDDRNCRQQQFKRRRRARSQQAEHAQREGDVGRRRDRPAAGQPAFASRHQSIDQRGHRHARCGGDHRQGPPLPVGQAPADEFPLDLQPDQQEKQRHQPVIDPEMDRGLLHSGKMQPTCLRFKQAMIEMRALASAIGHHQRDRGGGDQQQTACRLARQKGRRRR